MIKKNTYINQLFCAILAVTACACAEETKPTSSNQSTKHIIMTAPTTYAGLDFLNGTDVTKINALQSNFARGYQVVVFTSPTTGENFIISSGAALYFPFNESLKSIKIESASIDFKTAYFKSTKKESPQDTLNNFLNSESDARGLINAQQKHLYLSLLNAVPPQFIWQEGSSSQPGANTPTITKASIIANTLTLSLRNKSDTSTAVVQIDVQSEKFIKSTIDGKDFPIKTTEQSK